MTQPVSFYCEHSCCHGCQEGSVEDMKDTRTRSSVPESMSLEPCTDRKDSELHCDVTKKLKIHLVMTWSSSGRAKASAPTAKRMRRKATCPICHQLMMEPVSYCGQSCSCEHTEGCFEEQQEKSWWSRYSPPCQADLESESDRGINQGLIETHLKMERERLCEEHGEQLHLFCQDDRHLICWSFECSSQHRGQKHLVKDICSGYKFVQEALEKERDRVTESESQKLKSREQSRQWKKCESVLPQASHQEASLRKMEQGRDETYTLTRSSVPESASSEPHTDCKDSELHCDERKRLKTDEAMIWSVSGGATASAPAAKRMRMEAMFPVYQQLMTEPLSFSCGHSCCRGSGEGSVEEQQEESLWSSDSPSCQAASQMESVRNVNQDSSETLGEPEHEWPCEEHGEQLPLSPSFHDSRSSTLLPLITWLSCLSTSPSPSPLCEAAREQECVPLAEEARAPLGEMEHERLCDEHREQPRLFCEGDGQHRGHNHVLVKEASTGYKDEPDTLTRSLVPESVSSEPHTDCNDSELHCDERKRLKSNEATIWSISGGATASNPTAKISKEEVICSICLELMTEPVSMDCGHSFCRQCIENWIEQTPGTSLQSTSPSPCPLCRAPCHREYVQTNKQLENVIQTLKERVSERRCEDHREPLYLFCEFTGQLICQLCEQSPQHSGHNHDLVNEACPGYKERLETEQLWKRELAHQRQERELREDITVIVTEPREQEEQCDSLKLSTGEQTWKCQEHLEKDNNHVKQSESQNLKSAKQSRECQDVKDNLTRNLSSSESRRSVPESVSSEPHTDFTHSEIHCDVRKPLKIYPAIIGSSSGKAMANLLASKRIRKEATCAICKQLMAEPVSSSSGHSCCRGRVEGSVDKQPEESSWSSDRPLCEALKIVKLSKLQSEHQTEERQRPEKRRAARKRSRELFTPSKSKKLESREDTREQEDMKVTLTRGSVPESASSEPRTDCKDSELHRDERKKLKTNEGGAMTAAPAAETSGEQPGTSGEQPETSGEQPGTSEYQPETSGEQPNSV
ncbi:uncharacterized protein LOC119251743 [Talpa occidentalis]|uniref:uncharacterized protein LOC119251743 n=1 Tax=Talpa occidentalis TaxID=50954 RepID=UPI0023F801F0|nr:uncharacterized protein LOC119251743 [Talpa occidentalis]